jgi:hypothetical protein
MILHRKNYSGKKLTIEVFNDKIAVGELFAWGLHKNNRFGLFISQYTNIDDILLWIAIKTSKTSWEIRYQYIPKFVNLADICNEGKLLKNPYNIKRCILVSNQMLSLYNQVTLKYEHI